MPVNLQPLVKPGQLWLTRPLQRQERRLPARLLLLLVVVVVWWT
jgi:hypothetical protein